MAKWLAIVVFRFCFGGKRDERERPVGNTIVAGMSAVTDLANTNNAQDLAPRAAPLDRPRGELVADRLGLDGRDGEPDVAAVGAAGPALHVVAVPRLGAGEERIDLGG